MIYKIDERKNECIMLQRKNLRLPVAWSNVLTNKNFGCVITDSFGGYTFYKNSKTNKITTFSNDAYLDESSEIIEFENKNRIWSIDVKNCPDENEYITKFGLGYAIFEHESDNFSENLTVFVPIDDNLKVHILKLTNKTNDNQDLCIGYNVHFQMGENEHNNKICEVYNKELNIVKVKNLKNPTFISFITSSEKMDKSKKIHLEFNPNETKEIIILLGVYDENFDTLKFSNEKSKSKSYDNKSNNVDGTDNKSNNVDGTDKKISYLKFDGEKHNTLGYFNDDINSLKYSNEELEIIDMSVKYFSKYNKFLDETKKYWKNLTQKLTVKTDDKSFNIMQNGPLVYQTIASRLYARCGFYQVSGAFGFRDQLQDAICMKWVDTDILKNQIILCANHQFLEGDVLHWWHDDTSLGIRTRYSDDMLFLVLAVCEYIEFTGDYDILNINANYIIDEELKPGENDKVKNYLPSEFGGCILEHVTKAINRACDFGKDGIPLMKSGDWNDGMNNIGKDGKGESIWLGFFLYENIDRFLNLIEENKNFFEEKLDKTLIAKYQKIKDTLKVKLNTICWDGKWFIRAIDDNGNIIGSMNSNECKIDSISQSFSVISNAGDNDKKYIAMKSAEEMLLDDNHHIVKLLTPSLEKENLGYISSYAKGMRENGGQYTHAAAWLAIAECILGKNEEAYNIYKKINPIEHAKSEEALQIYKVEPYVVAADIYGENNLAGRGGWTWYTGSSAWTYELQVEYILGLKVHHKQLSIKPCIPNEWNKIEVYYKFKEANYTFNFIRNLNAKKNEYAEIVDVNSNHTLKEIPLKEKGNYIYKVFYN